jgi:CubicO group peptidase (beta-lactamase class C family)
MNCRDMLRTLAGGALMVLAAGEARAEGTFDIPAGAHFNQQKLAKIGEFFKNEVATGKIPGAVLLIEQHGKPVYHEFFGVRDPATKLPMTDDTIFRIFSMTKPITSVAAMMLVDQGKLKLDDAIEKYIPSFGKARSASRRRRTMARRRSTSCR